MSSRKKETRRARQRTIARQFPENSMKFMLENPMNVKDLLALTMSDIVKSIDFDRMRLMPTTFVAEDFRHKETDRVLAAPLLQSPGTPSARKRISVYILIEHQSKKDRFMPFRMLDYVVQIYRFQARRWAERHRSHDRLRLQPVLPVVLYTGIHPWDRFGTMADLAEAGDRFQFEIPSLTPHFLNLPALESDRLEQEGGFFGWVLRLWQDRKSRRSTFRRVLVRVIQHLETMPGEEQLRLMDLLSCIRALVYHSRKPGEQPDLQTLIESSLRSNDLRQEVSEMGKTMADVHEARGLSRGLSRGLKKGRLETTRAILLRLLRRRLVEVPQTIVERIEETDDLSQLNIWFDRAITAETIEEVGIPEA